jgi:hypothetical protein
VLPGRQHGASIRGSVLIARSHSRLKVTVLAGRATAGVLTRTTGPGKAPFSISLRLGRSSRRERRLALTVKVSVTPVSGAPYTATRQVVLKPAT